MSLLSSSFGHSSTVTSHCLLQGRVADNKNNYDWTDGLKATTPCQLFTTVLHKMAFIHFKYVFDVLSDFLEVLITLYA